MQNNLPFKKIVAITGGIASGKNTVGDILTAKGYVVIDVDDIVRKLNKRGNRCYKIIVKEFGTGFLDRDGEIDRKKFSASVFKDENLVKRLNALTHPVIIEEISSELQKINKEIIFVLIPLLFESNMQGYFDRVWTVSASEEIRIERAKKRNNLTAREIKNIMKNQLSEIERNKLADNIIYNEGEVTDLKPKVLRVLNSLTSQN